MKYFIPKDRDLQQESMEGFFENPKSLPEGTKEDFLDVLKNYNQVMNGEDKPDYQALESLNNKLGMKLKPMDPDEYKMNVQMLWQRLAFHSERNSSWDESKADFEANENKILNDFRDSDLEELGQENDFDDKKYEKYEKAYLKNRKKIMEAAELNEEAQADLDAVEKAEEKLKQEMPKEYLAEKYAELQMKYAELQKKGKELDQARDENNRAVQDAVAENNETQQKKLAEKQKIYDEMADEYAQLEKAYDKLKGELNPEIEKKKQAQKNEKEVGLKGLKDLCSSMARYDEKLMSEEELREFRKKLKAYKDNNKDSQFDKNLLDYKSKMVKKIGDEFETNPEYTPKLRAMHKAVRAIDGVMSAITNNPIGLVIASIALMSSPMLLAGFAVIKALSSKAVERKFTQLPIHNKQKIEKKAVANLLHVNENSISDAKISEMLRNKDKMVREAAEDAANREMFHREMQDLTGKLNKHAKTNFFKPIESKELIDYYKYDAAGPDEKSKYSEKQKNRFKVIAEAMDSYESSVAKKSKKTYKDRKAEIEKAKKAAEKKQAAAEKKQKALNQKKPAANQRKSTGAMGMG